MEFVHFVIERFVLTLTPLRVNSVIEAGKMA